MSAERAEAAGGSAGARGARESAWERRKRLAEVFGETLPETTRDEREPEPGQDRGNDAWLRAQVPPHHGS
ncbi:hypothetical protein [Nocardioides ochotonae]|uniref:hypothetical protein n=1 Tax=Nocardioides ochotonae TaxID=2685869 RepID=UPI001408088A|nr:hypothetical protein [Nocardioides ochotonae]